MKSVSSYVEFDPNPKHLQAKYLKDQEQIQQIQKRLEEHRKQLKALSNSASKIIDKKLSKPTGIKSRPKLNPTFESHKLQLLQDQKQKIYRQVAQTKQLIAQLKLQQEPEVKGEILKKEIQFKQTEIQLEKTFQEKKYVLNKLKNNKDTISGIKESQFSKDFVQNQKILQQFRKQKGILDKKIYQQSNDQIMVNMYYFQLKQKTETKQQKVLHDLKISPQQIKHHINQINQIIEERNKIQKDKINQISSLKNLIAQIQKNNSIIQKKIRQTQGLIQKKHLEDRFFQTRIQRGSKSVSQLQTTKQYTSVYVPKVFPAQVNDPTKQTKLKKSNLTQRRLQNVLMIGSCQIIPNTSISILKDPTAQSEDVDKLHDISFIFLEQKLIGIKTTYLTKSGKPLEGKFVSTLQKINLHKAIQKQILIKDVKEIEVPKSSKNASLKIHKWNGDVQNIGVEYYGATIKENISLKPIKSVDLVIQKGEEDGSRKLKGVMINLQPNKNNNLKKQREQVQLEEGQINEHNQSHQNGFNLGQGSSFGVGRKAQSIDNIQNYKKKLVLKPLKKEVDQNLDHRLLIRKKLV